MTLPAASEASEGDASAAAGKQTGCARPPQASLVIPALNEAHHLAELLPQLRQQSVPAHEIILADAGSLDATREVARAHGASVVPGGRPAQGRNSGAAVADGEWLVFVDADTRLPERTTLEHALREGERTGAAALVADYRPYYRPGDLGYDRPWTRWWDSRLFGLLSSAQRAWLYCGYPIGQAVFLAVRRAAFHEVGGFDPRAEPFEDSELLLRLHRRLPAPPGRRSAVAVLPRGLFSLVSTRRYDVRGRLAFPIRMGLRGGFLRLLLRRELPLPSYWELNERGLYREQRAPPRPVG